MNQSTFYFLLALSLFGVASLFLIFDSSMIASGVSAQNSHVKVAGAMRNVMMKGDLSSTIDLDTIGNKNHLFGIGPGEDLQGEILIVDGTTYHSSIDKGEKMKISKESRVKAPFFVYANIERWMERNLPDSVIDLKKFDSYLTAAFPSATPFAFKLTGKVKQANIHVVNLPRGTKIHSPKDAHIGQIDFPVTDVEAIMIGFFSTQHKGVFTHHDTNVHIHLITSDATVMGHLDTLKIDPAMVTLYIQKN